MEKVTNILKNDCDFLERIYNGFKTENVSDQNLQTNLILDGKIDGIKYALKIIKLQEKLLTKAKDYIPIKVREILIKQISSIDVFLDSYVVDDNNIYTFKLYHYMSGKLLGMKYALSIIKIRY